MKILLTGFEPFAGDTINPAWEAVKLISQQDFSETIIPAKIPTVFKESIDKTIEKIKQTNPDVVLMIGQAGKRHEIAIERISININDAVIEDNKGYKPTDEVISYHGPAAYFATIPIKKIVENLKNNDIPASISNTAGTFVCNHLMYGVLDFIATNKLPTKAGFIHIPFLPKQAVSKSAPSMSLEVIVKGVMVALQTIATNAEE